MTPSDLGITPVVECWPCGCVKGMTAHGAGWSDCIVSDEQKDEWIAAERDRRHVITFHGSTGTCWCGKRHGEDYAAIKARVPA